MALLIRHIAVLEVVSMRLLSVSPTKVLIAAIVCAAFMPMALGSFHDGLRAYVPQVVKGTLQHVVYKTIVVISNPGPDPSQITVRSVLLPLTVFQLSPGETRQVIVSGEPFQMGPLLVEATKIVAVAADIVARSSGTSAEILSQVTILSQQLTSKAILPVFRRSGATDDVLADNTGIALVGAIGRYELTLRDAQGLTVRTRSLQSNDFRTMFVTELFPDLPSSFSSGSLVIEHVDPPRIPLAFAVTALYMTGNVMRAAAVTSIDRPNTYFVKFKPTETQQKAQEMATHYGFTIVSFFTSDPLRATVTMLHEVARAVARDPRVESIEPDRVIPIG